MRKITDSVTAILKRAGIQPTIQRVRVLAYLVEHNTHPGVEQIYSAISAEEALLSRATVYNTLHALTRAGLVREITIEENETRYDAQLEAHGHFRCNTCGMIHNFSVNMDDIAFTGLDRFSITGKDVYFKGLCPNCQKPVQKEKEKNG